MEITVIPPRDVGTTQLLATNAAQMLSAEQGVLAFFQQQMREAEEELEEDQRQLAVAQKAGMCVRAIKRHLALSRQKITFFEKAVHASDAGFHAFPYLNDSTPFAIRVEDGVGDWGRFGQRYLRPSEVGFAESDNLPYGEGEYVSPVPGVTKEWDQQRQKITKWDSQKQASVFDRWEAGNVFYASSWKKVEVPEAIRNAAMMECIHRAMDHRVFDELRIAPGWDQKQDPVVLGTISDWRKHRSHRPLAFLVAWYLDLKTL